MTAPVRIGHASTEGPQLTVNMFVAKPTLIRNVVISMLDQQFIGESLLRKGPPASSGAVMWKDPQPLFANDDPEIVAEFGEIPGVETPGPVMHTKATIKRGGAIKVSEEMRSRNDVGSLQDQLRMLKNSTVRVWDKNAMNLFFGSGSTVDTMPSAGSWFGGTTTIRRDLADASIAIQQASYDDNPDMRFGFTPDTLVINPIVASEWLDNEEINKIFAGSPLASQDLRYTGKYPKKFFNFDVITSWQVPETEALLMQRGVVGFLSDERPLRTTPMYEHRPTETWRSDTTRRSVMALDAPQAALRITGIDS
jgi:hypothetical protein